MNSIAQNLAQITSLLQQSSPHTQLIAVSKTHPVAAIEQAIAWGQRVFGENRVQEALQKFPALKKYYPDIELHLLGALQTNKIKEAIECFDVIETLDRKKLADAFAKEHARGAVLPKLYIQVNTGNEPQKAGVLPQDAPQFILYCKDTLRLPVVGLMCIPPVDEPPAPHFAYLKELAAVHHLPYLSMGMSSDWQEAITFGATHIRVGTAIFGNR
jgi:hypothetical protein